MEKPNCRNSASPSSSVITNNFNSQAQLSLFKAVLKQSSDTVTDGNCLFDACTQGMRLNEDKRNFTYSQLRKSSARWAQLHPDYIIGKDLTLIQHLSNHLNNTSNELTQADYVKWWQSVETSKCYAESPVLAVLGVYLDYNICVWRRTIK